MDCIAGTKLICTLLRCWPICKENETLLLLHTSVQDSKWIQRGAMKQHYADRKVFTFFDEMGFGSKPDEQLGLEFRMLR